MGDKAYTITTNAIEAAIARIHGEWDNEHLMSFGTMSVDETGDLLYILGTGLCAAKCIHEKGDKE